MKKVLSAILAAAMVMGMSVTAMAKTVEYSVPASTAGAARSVAGFEWGKAYLNRTGESVFGNKDLKLEEGDVLYFAVSDYELVCKAEEHKEHSMAKCGCGLAAHKDIEHEYQADCTYGCNKALHTHAGTCFSAVSNTFTAPANWIVKIQNAEYVDDAELVNLDIADADDYKFDYVDNQLFVKVKLAKDFNAKDIEREDPTEKVEFFMYIVDKNTREETDIAKVHYSLNEYDEVELTAAMIKDVVEVEEETIYYLAKGLKSQMVVFDFDGVLVKAKLFEGEKYLVKPEDAFSWNKEISKKYDTNVDVITFNTELDVREVIFESAKDNKQVVAVVDGALEAVESEFVTKYKIIKGVELTKGYVAEIDANAGAYALIDAEVEVEVEAEEEPVEAEKANPETGAADFVGAAVAMAVVSVAAAGALALKK